MCDTCPCTTSGSSIPGPTEVAGGVLTAAVGAAISKPGRKVLFWGLCVPALPFAIWGELHWWTLVLVALAAAGTAAGVAYGRILHRSVVQARPELTHEMRAALAARGLKPIPAPARVARPALPRAMVRSLTGGRRALPAPAKALPGAVVTGTVVPAPVMVPRNGER